MVAGILRFTSLFSLLWKLSFSSNNRIINGVNITIEEAPFFVQVVLDGNFCGGSILNPRMVLTAAHCVDDKTPLYLVRVLAGSDQLREGVSYNVEDKIVHGDYGYFVEHSKDIAILILQKELEYSKTVQPIKIPNWDTKPLHSNTEVFVLGMGRISAYGPQSVHLQRIYLPITDETLCDQYLMKALEIVDPSQLCIGKLTSINKDACTGDSGSPVVYQGTQIGIVSWGEGCGEFGKPGVYTNVNYMKSWIIKTVKSYTIQHNLTNFKYLIFPE